MIAMAGVLVALGFAFLYYAQEIEAWGARVGRMVGIYLSPSLSPIAPPADIDEPEPDPLVKEFEALEAQVRDREEREGIAALDAAMRFAVDRLGEARRRGATHPELTQLAWEAEQASSVLAQAQHERAMRRRGLQYSEADRQVREYVARVAGAFNQMRGL